MNGDVVIPQVESPEGQDAAATATGAAAAYNFVFITHLPSFYKVNLYEQLSRRGSVFVIFLGASSTIRTADFVKEPAAFDHFFLSQGSVERRPTLANLWRLWRLLRTLRPRLLLVNGWELPEFWLGMLLARCPRGLVMETTGFGVSPRGLKATVKKLFLSCVDLVMASGQMHAAFIRRLGFQGEVYVTQGVGIINKPNDTPPLAARSYKKKFLYIGRLSPEKNVDFMLALFRRLAPDGFTLTVAGGDSSFQDGNIRHVGYQANDRVPELFAAHDFLILPSLSEPWGLVIEESLYCGTPVAVSEACGASELVDDGVNGVLLDVGSLDVAAARLRGINAEDHGRMRAQCGRAAIDAKDQEQMQRYLEALASATR
jgi:glycosyltransferase involved in cell wall biosynthesis